MTSSAVLITKIGMAVLYGWVVLTSAAVSMEAEAYPADDELSASPEVPSESVTEEDSEHLFRWGNEGMWFRTQGPDPICPLFGKICAEWHAFIGQEYEPCCIPREYESTSYLQACDHLRPIE